MISPEIWFDEDVQSLSCGDAILCFIGVFSNADDEGRIEWSARQIYARVFAMRSDVTVQDVENYMREIAECGLVVAYEHNGKMYAALPQWNRHQIINKAKPSTLPEPPDTVRVPEEYGTSTVLVRDDYRLKEGNRIEGRGGACAREITPPSFAELEPDVVVFVTLAAGENKTGAITSGREIGLRQQLAGVLDECGDRAAFAAGLREANAKGKPNANYVRACVRSAMQRNGDGSMPKRRPAAPRVLA